MLLDFDILVQNKSISKPEIRTFFAKLPKMTDSLGTTTILLLITTITTTLLYLLNRNSGSRSSSEFLEQFENKTCVWTDKRILVLLNPFGGHGAAREAWNTVVKPSLAILRVNYELIETKHANHAFSLMKVDLDLKLYRGMIVISGDGMLHQVLNGLYARANFQVSVLKEITHKLPILVVPGGTMNGFSSSLNCSIPQAAMLKLASCTKPSLLDCYTITTASAQKFIDVHCMSAGIVADHDNLLERDLRMFPNFLRLIITPIIVILRSKSYQGILLLKPSKDQSGSSVTDINKLENHNKSGWKVIEDGFMLLTIINTRNASFDMLFAPDALPDDGSIYALVVRKGISRWKMIQIFLAFERGTHINFKEMEIYKIDAAEYLPADTDACAGVSGEVLPSGKLTVNVEPRCLSFVY